MMRGRAVWSAHRTHNPEVEGSNPSPAIRSFYFSWHKPVGLGYNDIERQVLLMGTRYRLLRYSDLLKTDREEAQKFLEDNNCDQRFVSLVDIGTTFVNGFKQRMTDRQ